MTLKYPTEIGGMTDSDYVQFVPMPYRSNARSETGGAVGGAGQGAPPSSGAQSVILYMPNSTPTVGNGQDWGRLDFPGPLGALQKDAAGTVIRGMDSLGNGTPISSIVETIGNDMSGHINKNTGIGLAKQAALKTIPQELLGGTPNQMLAVSKGEVYNPNVELLYTSPKMRGFSFSFDFIPKTSKEAQMVNQIIRNFKIWSSPKAEESGMFEIPHVWQVKYMTGGNQNKNMNQFKKAAITGVSVQANPQTNMHVAHAAGVPISTTMQLTFQEVDIITRQDHQDAGGQGF